MIAVALFFFVSPAFARTITLTAQHADRMACVAAEAPRASWATYEPVSANFVTTLMDLYATRSFLIRIPLDAIPQGQKITRAELVVPVNYLPTPEVRLFVWRMLPEWGAGVCYQYRAARPAKVEWNVPGGKGDGSDRAPKPTAIERVTKPGQTVVNVTQDVEMWYKSAAPNQGWMLSLEDEGAWMRFDSPLFTNRASWILRITYEPE